MADDCGRLAYGLRQPKPSEDPGLIYSRINNPDLEVLEDEYKGKKLFVYVEPGKLDQAGWAMDCLKRAIAWDEKRFGLKLDLDEYKYGFESDVAIRIADRKTPIVDPADRPIRAGNPVFLVVFRGHLTGARGSEHALAVLRVNALGPIVHAESMLGGRRHRRRIPDRRRL